MHHKPGPAGGQLYTVRGTVRRFKYTTKTSVSRACRPNVKSHCRKWVQRIPIAVPVVHDNSLGGHPVCAEVCRDVMNQIIKARCTICRCDMEVLLPCVQLDRTSSVFCTNRKGTSTYILLVKHKQPLLMIFIKYLLSGKHCHHYAHYKEQNYDCFTESGTIKSMSEWRSEIKRVRTQDRHNGSNDVFCWSLRANTPSL